MKKFFLLIAAMVLSMGAVQAKLIFHESFGGENGVVGQLNAGTTDDMKINDFTFEQTRWWNYSGSSNFIKVEEGSLSYEGYQTMPIGNKAYLWSNGADDLRSFISQAVNANKLYLAAIINVDVVKANASPDYFISMGDHSNSRYTFSQLYTKSVQTDGEWTGFRLGVAKNNENSSYIAYTEEVFAPKTNYLVVLEYEFVSGAKNDIVRLYVNPTQETTEPTLVCNQEATTGGGSQVGANAKDDANEIYCVCLRQGSNTPKMYVDEIKVATSWADVWKQKTVDEQPGDNPGENPEDSTANNIAALKAYTTYQPFTLNSHPVVIHLINYDPVIQDASGAIIVEDFIGLGYLNNVQVGDQLANLTLTMTEEDKFINGLPTARLSKVTTPEVESSGNEVEAFDVTMSTVTQYGPALVQLREVTFETGTLVTFYDAGMYSIVQEGITADLQVPVGCDLIGEEIPGKADVRALVVRDTEEEGLRLRVRSSADLTNRVAKGDATGMDAVQDDTRCTKVLREGQLYLQHNGTLYTIQGQRAE